jgi:hypothetical protein
LVTLEGTYAQSWTFLAAPAQAIKVWEWNGFGFTVVSTLDGEFNTITLVQATNKRILILVP